MKRLVFFTAIVFFLCAALFTSQALSFEYPAPFKIKSMYISYEENYHVRVISSNPGSWLCSYGPTYESWAYINRSDDGFKAKFATLLTAFVTGKTINISTTGSPMGDGVYACRIEDIHMLGN